MRECKDLPESLRMGMIKNLRIEYRENEMMAKQLAFVLDTWRIQCICRRGEKCMNERCQAKG